MLSGRQPLRLISGDIREHRAHDWLLARWPVPATVVEESVGPVLMGAVKFYHRHGERTRRNGCIDGQPGSVKGRLGIPRLASGILQDQDSRRT